MAMTGSGLVDAPGLAEIKPESPQGIRAGLHQLRTYVCQSERARGGPPCGTPKTGGKTHRAAWISGTEPQRSSVWLITYLPWPDRQKPSHVRVFAYEVERARLLAKGPLPPTQSLLKSRRELAKVPIPETMKFPVPVEQPDMFGLAIERHVRDEFRSKFRRALDRRQDVGRQGPDVLWLELADLFRELAAETGDTYWREVADELSLGV